MIYPNVCWLHVHFYICTDSCCRDTFLSLNPAKQQQLSHRLFGVPSSDKPFKVLEILGIILVHDLVIQKNIRKCVDILTLLIQRLVDDGTASQNSTLARIQMIINGNKHNKGSLAIYWDQLKMC